MFFLTGKAPGFYFDVNTAPRVSYDPRQVAQIKVCCDRKNITSIRVVASCTGLEHSTGERVTETVIVSHYRLFPHQLFLSISGLILIYFEIKHILYFSLFYLSFQRYSSHKYQKDR